MASLKYRLRDPVWQFVGVIVAIASLVVTLAIWIAPKLFAIVDRLSESVVGQPSLPKLYQADAPGPECDKGGARWTLRQGNVTCTDQRAVYEDAFVVVDWPGSVFPPAYEIILHVDALGPKSCVVISVRHKYAVLTCASGGAVIYRDDPQRTVLAGEPTREFTQTQIMVRVEERKLTLTMFAFNIDGVVTLTVEGDAYGSGDVLGIMVTPPADEPAEHAKATLYGFQYRAVS